MGRKPIRSFEDLEVFQRAYRLSLSIHAASKAFPAHEQFELARQLRTASKSICANIAEGFGKQSSSTAEFGRFLAIAIGSADEATRSACGAGTVWIWVISTKRHGSPGAMRIRRSP